MKWKDLIYMIIYKYCSILQDFTFSSPLSMDSQNSAKPKSVTFEIGPSKTKETPAAFSSPGFKFGSPVNVQSTSSSYLGASPVLPKPSHGTYL